MPQTSDDVNGPAGTPPAPDNVPDNEPDETVTPDEAADQ